MAQGGILHATSTVMKIHPLENKVIMEEILSYCPATIESLKTLRLVSKSWKEACAPRWMSFAVPIVITQEEEQQQDYHKGDSSNTLEKFLHEYKNPKSVRFPQRRMTLQGWILENDHFEPAMDDIVTIPAGLPPIVNNVWQPRSIPGHGGIYFKFEEEDAVRAPTQLSALNHDFWKSSYHNVTTLELNGCTLPCHINLFPDSFLKAFPNLGRLNLISCVFPSFRSNDFVRRCSQKLGWNIHKERENAKIQFPLVTDKRILESHVRHSLRLPSHEKLTSLRVENMESRIPLTILLILFPNLETFTVRKAPNCEWGVGSIEDSAVTQTLKSLDIMQVSYLHTYQRTNVTDLSLEELALDSGADYGLEGALDSQSATLKKLKLYSNPFFEAYSNLPCNVAMTNLTELHLWGNMSENLNFLKFMPKLQVLKWNINCYDENDHGARIHKYMKLGKCEHLLFPFQILENTTELSNEFKLDNMRSFEMSWGPITDECFALLGKWMPNLKELKGTVMNDVELEVIADQWSGMEHLELAHTSKVSAFGILNVLSTQKLLQQLKSFTWKWCPCIKRIADTKVRSQEMLAENELRKLAGRNVTVPWKRFSTANQQEGKTGNGGTCLQALFEKVLTYDDSASTTEFFNKVEQEKIKN